MTRNFLKVYRTIPKENYIATQKVRYATVSSVRFKPNTLTDNALSTDDKMSHVKVLINKCDIQKCGEKKCVTLCSNLESLESDGHFTHNPIVGKFSRFVSEKDILGNDKSQYYTTNSDKSKKINAADVKPGDIKNKPDYDQYRKIHANKFED